jgi:hypothetical protein
VELELVRRLLVEVGGIWLEVERVELLVVACAELDVELELDWGELEETEVEDWLPDVVWAGIELDVELLIWLLEVWAELKLFEDVGEVTEAEEDGEYTPDVDDGPTELLEGVATEELDDVETDREADVNELNDAELVVLLSAADDEDTTPVKFWYKVNPLAPPQISPEFPPPMPI